MKKLTLLMLVLFGTGLATISIAASSDNPMPKTAVAPCNGNVFNRTPCDLRVCIIFMDCNGNVQNECPILIPGGALNIPAYLASMGYCCNGIIGVTAQVLPGAPVSPVVAPGTSAVYVSGVAGPCMKLVIDYMSAFPDCIIHP